MSLLAVEPSWVCSACAFSNVVNDLACLMCGSTRQSFLSRQVQQKFDPRNMNGNEMMWGSGLSHFQQAQVLHSHVMDVSYVNKSSFPTGGSVPRKQQNGAKPMMGKKPTPYNNNGMHSVSAPVPIATPPRHQKNEQAVPSTPQTPNNDGSPSNRAGELTSEIDGQQKRDPKLGQNADEDERRATEEGRKVFVGNLKRPITRQEVVDHFSKFGEVERVILNSGFGLVLMVTREGALKATEQRWQALDWRNVEVFVYTKGAKGASWNRPYAVPPRPGPCSLCGLESAEHCSLCTSALCLNDKTTCTSCCRSCQRSFCRGGKECGEKDGLDACDFCGSLTCLFCALRLEATCAQCGRQFSARIQENARSRARRMVNARIGENDGSVYALVCLLKGDMESSREGQLVASIDRASKLFDPKASSWCMLTALRAIKELDDSWEATKRVHNLRALRRSAKQWSTDLTALTVPPGSTTASQGPVIMPVVPLPVRSGPYGQTLPSQSHNFMGAPSSATQYMPSPFPHAMNFSQQQQFTTMVSSNGTHSAALANTLVSNASAVKGGEDMLFAALRSSETYLLELDPRPKQEAEWLISHLRNIALSVTQKRSVFLEELCMRMEVWTLLLRRLSSQPTSSINSASNMSPLSALKRAIVDLDSFYNTCRSMDEFAARKDAYLGEVLRAARELKRSAPPFSSAELLLRRAGRSARNMDTRALLVSQGVLPFDACLHHCRYRRCSLLACPFNHHLPSDAVMNDVDQREFDAADYEFSNEQDELSIAAAAARRPTAPNPQSTPFVPNSWSSNSNPPTTMLSPNGTGFIWSGTAPALFLPPPSQQHQQNNVEPKFFAPSNTDKFLDWNSTPERLLAVSSKTDEVGSTLTEEEVTMHVMTFCDELRIQNEKDAVLKAFLASGATKQTQIWDTDLVMLHKELSKDATMPAATRMRIIQELTEHRQRLSKLPSLDSLYLPADIL